MKLITWNVNGLRACIQKGFLDYVREADPDIIALQETKMQPDQAQVDLPGYHLFWNSAEKKGYSGTAVFTKEEPLSVVNGIGAPQFDCEGRTITAEYPSFYFVTSYTPNAQEGLARIDYRMEYEDLLKAYLLKLSEKKPVILCGDLNVAATDMDLKNPNANRGNAGFSDQEKEKHHALLAAGFTDCYRHLYPDRVGEYTWWSYRFNARKNNAGWRIDYFIVSNNGVGGIRDVVPRTDVFGSDHCPVELVYEP